MLARLKLSSAPRPGLASAVGVQWWPVEIVSKHNMPGFHRWHAADIAWPPTEGTTARAAMEENRLWLQAQGVHVADNVDAFDLSGYLMTAGVRAEDVMRCIFNCAHG